MTAIPSRVHYCSTAVVRVLTAFSIFKYHQSICTNVRHDEVQCQNMWPLLEYMSSIKLKFAQVIATKLSHSPSIHTCYYVHDYKPIDPKS